MKFSLIAILATAVTMAAAAPSEENDVRRCLCLSSGAGCACSGDVARSIADLEARVQCDCAVKRDELDARILPPSGCCCSQTCAKMRSVAARDLEDRIVHCDCIVTRSGAHADTPCGCNGQTKRDLLVSSEDIFFI